LLDSFSVFLILALGWIAAGAIYGRKLPWGDSKQRFLDLSPGYWREHWKYSQWALATAFALQFSMQIYYWLVAAFLSVTEVARLRATYLLVAPVEQVSIAISLTVLPALAAHFAANRLEDVLSLWKRNALAVVAVTGLFALIVRIAGRAVMHAVYAGKFDGLAPLLYVLALSPIFTGIGGTLVNALNAVEQPKLVFFACLTSGIATFLLGAPLVTRLGLLGAVFGMLASGGSYIAALAVGFLFHVYKPARRAGLSRLSATAGLAHE
jgi:O-antigen/teichoic acid export membrane protein